jgi:hypothetical protein
MDTPFFKTFRIAPTTQQGGTQTIQQSIYLTHNNPCGANLLVFQEMGLTQIRYIDLKNYLDDIVSSEEMIGLFEEIRIAATNYISNPTDDQLYYRYLYTIMRWGQRAIDNLPVSFDYYPGYTFRVDIYDGSGTSYFDSFYPLLEIIKNISGVYELGTLRIVPSQPLDFRTGVTNIYKLTSGPRTIPFINDGTSLLGLAAIFSNFLFNQAPTVETEMAVSSLLIDSANTRTFGIPKYGFSARQNVSQFGGIVYNCAHFIEIRTTPDENGNTTLVESIFFRLSLNEDTYNFSSPASSLQTKLSSTPYRPIEELMADQEIMKTVLHLINRDTENLRTNIDLLDNGQDKEVFRKYYYGTTTTTTKSKLSNTLHRPTPEMSIELLMKDEEIMKVVVNLVKNDTENLEANMELLDNGREKEIFTKYYETAFPKTS